MAIFTSGLLLLLVAAMISINYYRTNCKELNEELDGVSIKAERWKETAWKSAQENSELNTLNNMLKSQLGERLGITVEEEEVEEGFQFIDEACGMTKEQYDAAFEESESTALPFTVFSTMSKNPENKQEAFERAWQAMRAEREANGIYSNLTKGKK